MSALNDFLYSAVDAVQEVQHVAANTRDFLREVSDSPHAAPIHALIRQGADEIAQVLPAFPDSIQPQPELGQMFEVTPGMATEQIKGHEPEMEM